MNRAPRGCALLASLALVGCGSDLGMGAGVKDGHAVGMARLAASTRIHLPLNEQGPLLGVNLENRSEAHVGSRWSTGFMIGYGAGPAAFVGHVGYEVYAEGGVRLRSTYQGLDDAYVGIAAALPFSTATDRNVIDLNRSTWLLKRRLEFAPFVHVRSYFGNDERNFGSRLEFATGFACRLRVMSDIL